jgi:hypothetical protein
MVFGTPSKGNFGLHVLRGNESSGVNHPVSGNMHCRVYFALPVTLDQVFLLRSLAVHTVAVV